MRKCIWKCYLRIGGHFVSALICQCFLSWHISTIAPWFGMVTDMKTEKVGEMGMCIIHNKYIFKCNDSVTEVLGMYFSGSRKIVISVFEVMNSIVVVLANDNFDENDSSYNVKLQLKGRTVKVCTNKNIVWMYRGVSRCYRVEHISLYSQDVYQCWSITFHFTEVLGMYFSGSRKIVISVFEVMNSIVVVLANDNFDENDSSYNVKLQLKGRTVKVCTNKNIVWMYRGVSRCYRVEHISLYSQDVYQCWSITFHFNSPPPPPPPGQNGRHFGRRHFQMHFLEWKWYNSDSNFTDFSSHASNWQYASIGSGNGLAPNRRQAIIWTIDGPDHWRIYAALGGDELNRRKGPSYSCGVHVCLLCPFWSKHSEDCIHVYNLFLLSPIIYAYNERHLKRRFEYFCMSSHIIFHTIYQLRELYSIQGGLVRLYGIEPLSTLVHRATNSCLAAPSRHLIQCWRIFNWTVGNTIQWNLNRNMVIFILRIYTWMKSIMSAILFSHACSGSPFTNMD